MAVLLADGVVVPKKKGSVMSFGFASHGNEFMHDESASILERNCNFTIDKSIDKLKKTHIICTIGEYFSYHTN